MNRHIAIDVDRKMTLAVLALVAATLFAGAVDRESSATTANPGGNARATYAFTIWGFATGLSLLRAGQPAPQP
jgi:hypothetical protein